MNAHQDNRSPADPKQRRVARGLLLLVILISQGLIWWPRASRQNAANSLGPPLILTVTSGDRYGVAAVSVDGGAPVDARQAAVLIAEHQVDRRSVEMHIAGSVRHQQLALLHQALLDASESGHVPMTFVVTPFASRAAQQVETGKTPEATQPQTPKSEDE